MPTIGEVTAFFGGPAGVAGAAAGAAAAAATGAAIGAILVEDGQPVEFAEPLVVID